MRQPQNPQSPVVLPPRPTPGPERWPESEDQGAAWWWFGGLVGFSMAALGWAVSRRWRRRVQTNARAAVESEPMTPSEQVKKAAEQLRTMLGERLGEGFRALTVEELRQSREMQEVLDPDLRSRVLEVLDLAALVKFAGVDAGEDQGAAAFETVEACRLVLAGARSRTTGR